MRAWLSLPLLFLPTTVLAGGRTVPTAADAFGYQRLADGAPHCPYQWIDTSAGSPFLFAPSDTDPASDDGWADLALALPFVFYDKAHTSLRVSTNGYIAFTWSGFPADDGGYWRSDCPLPAIPDNAEAAFGRVYAMGGDLEAGSQGLARSQFFPTCPRAPSYGSDACTVIEWADWQRKGASGLLNAQVILYHARREIVIQYGPVSRRPRPASPPASSRRVPIPVSQPAGRNRRCKVLAAGASSTRCFPLGSHRRPTRT